MTYCVPVVFSNTFSGDFRTFSYMKVERKAHPRRSVVLRMNGTKGSIYGMVPTRALLLLKCTSLPIVEETANPILLAARPAPVALGFAFVSHAYAPSPFFQFRPPFFCSDTCVALARASTKASVRMLPGQLRNLICSLLTVITRVVIAEYEMTTIPSRILYHLPFS